MVLLFLLWEGAPQALIGQPKFFVQVAIAVLFIASTGAWFLYCVASLRARVVDFLPILWVVYVLSLSMFTNSVIYPKPLDAWLSSSYLHIGILGYYYYRVFRYEPSEVILGIVICGAAAAALSVADSVFQFSALNSFYRNAYLDPTLRRIVVNKNEVLLCLVACLATIVVPARAAWQMLIAMVFAAISGYAILVTFESRLALVAAAGALISLFVAHPQSRRGIALYALVLGSASLFFVGDVIGKYVLTLSDPDYLLKYNVQVRIDSWNYYFDEWIHSGMAGLGIMSPSEFASWVNNPIRLGIMKIYNLEDLGVWSSLFQFGFPGAAFVVWTTAKYLGASFRFGRQLGDRSSLLVTVAACVVVGLLISPVPVNFFSASWTSMWSGALAFVAFSLRSRAFADGVTQRPNVSETKGLQSA